MNPNVSNIIEEDGIMKFTLSNLNVSLANAIRRIILTDIPCVVFKTTPYNENKANIHVNTTRFNNEIVKQRLSCIPIYIDDIDAFPINDIILEVDEKNESNEIKIVTTENFKLKNVTTGKYLSKTDTSTIFPPDKISDDYIDFVRLRPKMSDNIDGEHIKLECTLSVSTASDDSMFNVVSGCSYGNTPDPIAINKAWTAREIEIKKMESSNAEEIEYIKKDWFALDSNRYFIPNSFDFTIETIGVFNNAYIVKKACEIMNQKLTKFIENMHSNHELIAVLTGLNTIPNCYEIILENEDYTLGKALEYQLYNLYYENNKVLCYCGFRKPHPHINISIIRIGFYDEIENKDRILTMLDNAVTKCKKVYETIINSIQL